MNLFLVYLLAALLFLFLLISLGFQPKNLQKLFGIIFIVIGIGGIGFYGYGYFHLYGGNIVSVMRTLFAVFCMFLGRNEIGAISQVDALKAPWAQVCIYTIHLLALYSTASTVVAGIGTRLIRRLNLLLLYHKEISVIYGAGDAQMNFAEKLQAEQNAIIVFIDTGSGGDSTRIMHMGSLLMSDDAAREPLPSFIRRIGMSPGSKRLHVYCLDENSVGNLRYAEKLRSCLRKQGILPSQTDLTILTDDASAGSSLQVSPRYEQSGGKEGVYGFGSVMALERAELSARLLIREYPPCHTMRFGSKGVADEDFEAIIVGFGRTGQAVLRWLAMNGQFCGSTFHVLVIDDQYTQKAGSFFTRYPGITKYLHIDFRQDNARSVQVYNYLHTCVDRLNYVVVCTSNDEENARVARDYKNFLRSRGNQAMVLQCSEKGVTYFSEPDGLPVVIDPFRPEVLCAGKLDRMAMILNHQYCLSMGRTLEEDWANCDYFSRMSCRASADYLEAYLCAAGLSRDEVRTAGWPDDPELLENLARMEHDRWCAFHYAMGYMPMPEEVFEARAKQRAAEIEATGSSSLRIAKDTEHRLHACLIPWEELDALSDREAQLTGHRPAYLQMDRDNVLMVPEMLRAEAEGESL